MLVLSRKNKEAVVVGGSEGLERMVPLLICRCGQGNNSFPQ